MNIPVLMDELRVESSNFCKNLRNIYGLEKFNLQRERYKTAIERFRRLYPKSSDVHVARAGGRLLISGEHLDYHHGFILNTALTEDIVVISSLNDGGFCFANMDSQFELFKIGSVNDVKIFAKPKRELTWKDYGCATIKKLGDCLKSIGVCMQGINFLVDGREEFGAVPIGVGLSSSGAFEVALISAALGAIGKQEKVSASEISNLCVSIESALGFVSGIQDPYGSLMGGNEIERGKFVQLIDCIPKKDNLGKFKVNSELITLPNRYVSYIVRVGDKKTTADGRDRHNVRVFEGEIGTFLLNRMLLKWIDENIEGLDNEKLISSYNSEIFGAENAGYPPFWKVSYLLNSNLNKIGLSSDEEIIRGLAEFLPKGLSREEIIERYYHLGITGQIFDDFIKKCQVISPFDLKYDIRGTVIHVLEENERTKLSAEALKKRDMGVFFELQKETGKSLGKHYHIYNQLSNELEKELSNLNMVSAARVLGPGSGANVLVWAREEDEFKLIREIERIGEQKLGWKEIPFEKRKQFMIKLSPGKGAGLIV